MEKGSEGWQVSSLLLKKMPLAVYGFKKTSLINDSFISEVKTRWRWRPRRRGRHLSPQGSCMVRIFRNVSQRWSFKKEFRMHCYAFEMYLKDGPLRRSSECIVMLS